MRACLDVDYRPTGACAAALTFYEWTDANAAHEKVVHIPEVEPYVPGEFFRRELPCLLAVLRTLPPLKTIIVDGYVWLDDADKPGLGAHLFRALNEQVEVIGVAKTKFRGATQGCEVLRGASKQPLYVSAAGMKAEVAADCVRSMYGPFRLPSLLSRVDFLSRHG